MHMLFRVMVLGLVLLMPVGMAQAGMTVSVADDEALGPFHSWMNVRTYGAVGDGVADDTAALQKALDDLGGKDKPFVLYFPAGKYRITRTLDLHERFAVTLTGEDPATTAIVWDGEPGGTMLICNGVRMPQFSRLTWDGRGKAGIGIAQWFDTKRYKQTASGVKHIDEIFVDMQIGISGGRMDILGYGQLDSETTVLRTRFIRNSVAGVSLGSFNALDWWIWDSQFVDCARGVTNQVGVGGRRDGAGNFMVYRSLFRRSTVADVAIANTRWFSLHHNVSIGSRRFVEAADVGRNAAQFIVKGNRVIDTVEPAAISVGNMGPLILIDNQFRSAGNKGPVVAMNGGVSGRDVVSIGNQYTVANPIALREPGKDRLLMLEDRVVERAQISDAIPSMQEIARNHGRRVLEIPPYSEARVIQAVIDIAASGKFENPVVHLPPGDYKLDRTLIIPAGARLQLAGDGEATRLLWNGGAGQPMLRLRGPSQATVRDIQFARGNAKPGAAISIENADQPGGRILMERSYMAGVTITGLQNTQVEARAMVGMDGLRVADSVAVAVIGSGNIAPIEMQGNSSLLVSDNWYEGRKTGLFSAEGGTFTLIGGHWAPADPVHGGGDTKPAIAFNDFPGKAAFIGMTLNLPTESNGIVIGKERAEGNLLFLGVAANKPAYFRRHSPLGQVNALSMGKYTQGHGHAQIPDQAEKLLPGILPVLQQVRAIKWDETMAQIPSHLTNVRLFRVMAVDAGTLTAAN